MTAEHRTEADPRVQEALAELQDLLAARYPQATFSVYQGDDPEGVYLRRWLPELGDVPIPLLHEPWKDPSIARRTGYPLPMLDLATSRAQALQAWDER